MAAAGRYNSLDLWTAFYPDNGWGIDAFMNVSTMVPLNVATSLLFVSNVAGILKMGERRMKGGLVVLENQNSATTVGLDVPSGTTLGKTSQETQRFGCPARGGRDRQLHIVQHLRVENHPAGRRRSRDQNGHLVGCGPGGTATVDRSLYEKRYAKLFAYVKFSDQENNSCRVTTFASIEAFGLSDSRPNDRMGIAWFYNGLHDDFKNAFGLVTPVGDLQGGEVYYNAQVTPWFNLTFDLQTVEPAIQRLDTAVVLGLRAHVRI